MLPAVSQIINKAALLIYVAVSLACTSFLGGESYSHNNPCTERMHITGGNGIMAADPVQTFAQILVHVNNASNCMSIGLSMQLGSPPAFVIVASVVTPAL